ncbi:MAG: hypothetical protein NVSMB47_15590 [Polyangiales bacterium]
MRTHALLLAAVAATTLAAAALAGCKSKAQKQADVAAEDVDHLRKSVLERHVDSLPRALPDAASKLPSDLDAAATAFPKLRDSTDALRAAKRSFFGLVDLDGQIGWVDESGWNVKGRVVDAGFLPVQECLAGKDFARGSGRFGGDPPDALLFMDAAPLRRGPKVTGCLVAVWEAIDASADLQSQLLTEHGKDSAKATIHNKPKEQRKAAMDEPDTWVALFRGNVVYLVESAYQPLEEATKTLDLAGKTKNGAWTGTFDVVNAGWGASAVRVPGLGPDVGLVVFRHEN